PASSAFLARPLVAKIIASEPYQKAFVDRAGGGKPSDLTRRILELITATGGGQNATVHQNGSLKDNLSSFNPISSANAAELSDEEKLQQLRAKAAASMNEFRATNKGSSAQAYVRKGNDVYLIKKDGSVSKNPAKYNPKTKMYEEQNAP